MSDLQAPKQLTVRLAEPKDAEPFARWAAENKDIPQQDVIAGMAQTNPTSVVLVIEEDGVPILYCPIYCALTIAYLGFNPDADHKQRLKAMEAMQKAISGFAWMHGVREIITYSKEEYAVAKWATKHGFTLEPRQAFKLQLKEN